MKLVHLQVNYERTHIFRLKMEKDFKGKVFAVTGAGRGISSIYIIISIIYCVYSAFKKELEEKSSNVYIHMEQSYMLFHWKRWMT